MIITRDMILGARITKIYETYDLADGLDNKITYFSCDRGFSFLAPSAGQVWEAVEIPAEATALPEKQTISSYAVKRTWLGGEKWVKEPDTEDDAVLRVTQATISAVLCGPFDPNLGCYYPWDADFLLSNGYRISCNPVAPHGTGCAGVHIFPPDAAVDNVANGVDYFSIPLNDATDLDMKAKATGS